ncbi:MAG: MFS transporter [Acidobacteria bacterium]|nr:MFS transporter [Acidobacteriota bacterium]
MDKKTAAVALMAVFSLAICFIILGSVSLELMQALRIDESRFGSLAMALFLTSCLVQFIIGPLVDRLGYKPIAVLGFSVTSAAMFFLAFASSYAGALLACILLGIGAMSLNTVGNTLIPVVLFAGRDPARASNLGNAFFGLGYVLTPWLFTIFLNVLHLSYVESVSIFGALVLLFLLFSLTPEYPQVSTGYRFASAVRLLGNGTVLVAALALFCYISLEASMGTWIRKLMTELYAGRADAAGHAGWVLGLFGVAMMIGRLLTSAVKNLTASGRKVLAGASLVSVAAILLMKTTSSPAAAIAAVVVAGLAFAPIFPTVVGVTFARFDAGLYGSIFGIIFAVGLLGGTFVPKWIGDLSVGSTVQQSLSIPAVMAGILFLVSLRIGRSNRKT